MSDIIAVQNLLVGGEQRMTEAEIEQAAVKLKWKESPAYRAAAIADLEALRERLAEEYEDDPEEGHREFCETVSNDPRLFRAACSEFVDANFEKIKRQVARERKRRA
ncbi:hypothetical protein [Nitrobacter sp.]|uniref:hypothetical protein n=1 Tax=Nitrobacter sp. TaxID=29420 RepID=UPI003F650258